MEEVDGPLFKKAGGAVNQCQRYFVLMLYQLIFFPLKYYESSVFLFKYNTLTFFRLPKQGVLF